MLYRYDVVAGNRIRTISGTPTSGSMVTEKNNMINITSTAQECNMTVCQLIAQAIRHAGVADDMFLEDISDAKLEESIVKYIDSQDMIESIAVRYFTVHMCQD